MDTGVDKGADKGVGLDKGVDKGRMKAGGRVCRFDGAHACTHALGWRLRAMQAFKAPEWALITDTIEAAFKMTTVGELMTPGPTLDFSRSVVKVAVHLELIKSVRELSVTQPVELVATIPRESWRRWIQVRGARQSRDEHRLAAQPTD